VVPASKVQCGHRNEFASDQDTICERIGRDRDNRNYGGGTDDQLNDLAVGWLKLNMPVRLDEIDALQRMIINFKVADGLDTGRYRIRNVFGDRLVIGPNSMLLLTGGDSRAGNKEVVALLDHLDVLKGMIESCTAGDGP
jgi:hypothetical protein